MTIEEICYKYFNKDKAIIKHTKTIRQFIGMNKKIEEILNDLEKENEIKIIYACEAGSREWSLCTGDSDYDIRFIYLFNDHRKYLSLKHKFKDTIDGFSDNRLYDWVGYDITKALKLLYQMNPNLCEWIYSSIVYKQDPNYNFVDIARNLLMKYGKIHQLLYHYRSMAKSNYCKLFIENENTAVNIKRYLCVIRPCVIVEWLIVCKKDKILNNNLIIMMNDLKEHLSSDLWDSIMKCIDMKRNCREQNESIKCIDDWISHVLNDKEVEFKKQKELELLNINEENKSLDFDNFFHSFLKIKFEN